MYQVLGHCDLDLFSRILVSGTYLLYIVLGRNPEGSLTLATGKCLWNPVKIKVCQSETSSH